MSFDSVKRCDLNDQEKPIDGDRRGGEIERTISDISRGKSLALKTPPSPSCSRRDRSDGEKEFHR